MNRTKTEEDRSNQLHYKFLEQTDVWRRSNTFDRSVKRGHGNTFMVIQVIVPIMESNVSAFVVEEWIT